MKPNKPIHLHHSRIRWALCLTALLLGALAASVRAAAPTLSASLIAKLTAGDGAAKSYFGATYNGISLSADGNTALVGSFYADTPGGTDAGSAYVFVRSGTTWTQQAKLTAGDGASPDYFGSSVSLSADGNTALVGSFLDDTPGGMDAGSAYVFVRSGTSWSQQAQLTASDAAARDWFGFSVCISGDGSTAVVGACLADTTAGAYAGSAYVFGRSGTTWSQQAKLTADDAAAGDQFGICVSVSSDGTTALVGAYGADTPGGTDPGSAYVFVRSATSWSQQAKLTAGDGASSDYFGNSVSLSGDGNIALVGAFYADTPGGTDAGSAYVFARSGTTWNQQAKLAAGDGAAGDNFGSSVTVSADGTTAAVGAYYADTAAGADAGSAYVYRLDMPNQPPTATNFVVGTLTNTSTTIALAKLLRGANANDPDGDTVSVSAVSPTSAHGGSVILGATTLTYTPLPGYSGTDSFTYTVSDGHGGTVTAQVLITVREYNSSATQLGLTAISGGWRFSFAGVAGRTYRVQRAPSPTGAWEAAASVVMPASGVGTYDDTNPPAGTGFYRAVNP